MAREESDEGFVAPHEQLVDVLQAAAGVLRLRHAVLEEVPNAGVGPRRAVDVGEVGIDRALVVVESCDASTRYEHGYERSIGALLRSFWKEVSWKRFVWLVTVGRDARVEIW